MTYYGTAGSRGTKVAEFGETEVRLLLAKGAMTVSNRTDPRWGRVHWRIAEALETQGVARIFTGPDGGRMVELSDGVHVAGR